MTRPHKQTLVRCALYTRKNIDDDGSVHAQRELSEALIGSRRNEGWQCLADHYDDSGLTGGDMDRPALQRLLADIAAGKVDCVVVAGVDRLSRSLLVFTRIMANYQKQGILFVSVAPRSLQGEGGAA